MIQIGANDQGWVRKYLVFQNFYKFMRCFYASASYVFGNKFLEGYALVQKSEELLQGVVRDIQDENYLSKLKVIRNCMKKIEILAKVKLSSEKAVNL